MMRGTRCFTPDEIVECLLGKAKPNLMALWEEHWRDCALCRELADRYECVRDALVCDLAQMHEPKLTQRARTLLDETITFALSTADLATATEARAIADSFANQNASDDEVFPTAAPPGYEVGRLIGKGGFGAAFVVFQGATGAVAAIKIPRANRRGDQQVLARFEREARVLQRLRHAAIVRYIDSGRLEDGLPFLVQELLDGDTVSSLVRTNGPLSVSSACRVAHDILGALEYAFRNGVVHRDIAPKNVFIAPDGAVHVADWGLAGLDELQTAANDRFISTSTGEFWGTPAYASPEQKSDFSRCDTRADIYSTGWTLVYMLTGLEPGNALLGDASLITVGQEETPLLSLRPDLPQRLVGVLRRMLAAERNIRPSTPGETLRLLQPFCDASTSALRHTTIIAPGETPSGGSSKSDTTTSLIQDAKTIVERSKDATANEWYMSALRAANECVTRAPLCLGFVGGAGIGKTSLIRSLVHELPDLSWQTSARRLIAVHYARKAEATIHVPHADVIGPLSPSDLIGALEAHGSNSALVEMGLPSDFLARGFRILELPSDVPSLEHSQLLSADVIVCCLSPDVPSPSEKLLNSLERSGHNAVLWVVTRMDSVRRESDRERLVDFGLRQLSHKTTLGSRGVGFVSALQVAHIDVLKDEDVRFEFLHERLLQFLGPWYGFARHVRPLRLLQLALQAIVRNGGEASVDAGHLLGIIGARIASANNMA